ncbi:MAG: hypothetical protein QXH35_08460 [Nitrososphaerota archaeon]
MKVIDLREDAILPEKLRRHFPHAETRRFQADLSLQLHDSLTNNSKTVVVEAPTGLGKRLWIRPL